MKVFNETVGRGPESREITTLCLMAEQKEMDAVEGQASWRGQSQHPLGPVKENARSFLEVGRVKKRIIKV